MSINTVISSRLSNQIKRIWKTKMYFRMSVILTKLSHISQDDWRARVRGLERTASALRTSSALVTVEPRLGSLLQAVLGGERSSRIAAAGMAVAKVDIFCLNKT